MRSRGPNSNRNPTGRVYGPGLLSAHQRGWMQFKQSPLGGGSERGRVDTTSHKVSVGEREQRTCSKVGVKGGKGRGEGKLKQ